MKMLSEIASTTLSTLRFDLDNALSFARNEKAPATRRAYGSDWRLFECWCAFKSVPSLPAAPETVAAFLAYEASRGTRASTIGRRCAAVRFAHKLAGHEPPTNSEPVRATLRGIRRTLGTAKIRKTPATSEKVIAMVTTSGRADLKGKRDRALILLGFAGAFRRSELVALDVEHLEFCDSGLRVTIRRSKTDQEAAGQTIAIVRGSIACPVAELRGWLEAAHITSGPVFRAVAKGGRRIADQRLSDRAIANVVKAAAQRLGLNAFDFSGHSLRSGFLTSAAARGASIFKMMDVSRHRSMDTLRGYVRDADLFRDHAGAGLL
jgi:site-specific recombinase XerD